MVPQKERKEQEFLMPCGLCGDICGRLAARNLAKSKTELNKLYLTLKSELFISHRKHGKHRNYLFEHRSHRSHRF